MAIVLAARAPGPVVVVIDPATIVIWSPSPRLITDPRPSVGCKPGPMTITIWSPVVIAVYDCDVRLPNPTVVVCINPIAVGVQILSSPNMAVVILRVIGSSLGKETFPL